jgi:sensor domain CHASE-containing protein
MFENDARSLVTAQEGQRRAEGIDYKQQGSQAEDEATARRRREMVTAGYFKTAIRTLL